MISKTAVIAGATGLTGRFLLDLLLRSGDYKKVIALTRKKIRVQNKKLEQYLINFDQLESHSELLNADDIFCCLGTTIKKAGSQDSFRKVDFEYVVKLAELSHLKNARQFLMISALGADPDSRIFYNRVKGDAELAVQDFGFRATHIFRPSMLLGSRREFRAGEFFAGVILHTVSPVMIGKLKRYRGIKARDVAAAMLNVAGQVNNGVHIYESEKITALAKKKSR